MAVLGVKAPNRENLNFSSLTLCGEMTIRQASLARRKGGKTGPRKEQKTRGGVSASGDCPEGRAFVT